MSELILQTKERKRTDYCGILRAEDIGRKVTLMGWVAVRRDFGSLIFVHLRDRTGLVQCVFNRNNFLPDDYTRVESLRDEYVISVTGMIQERSLKNRNPNMQTGEIEIVAEDLLIFSKAEMPPFYIQDGITTREDLRLKYRYLDLRRPEMQQAVLLRHQLAQITRNYLSKEGFLEIETPMLTKDTPEGARTYLVPSRVQKGKFFSLPQSPQMFKQLCMVSGFDRYFQIVRCFRDEDLRADRQPEFTQIDMEMSFVSVDDILTLSEGLIKKLFQEAWGSELAESFPRMTYQEAMDRFGSDKPDIRFGLELCDISEIVESAGFSVFEKIVHDGGSVRCICVPNGNAVYGRGRLDTLTAFCKDFGAQGLAFMGFSMDGTIRSPIAKFFSDDVIGILRKRTKVCDGDLLLIVADQEKETVMDVLGRLRLKIGEELGMIKQEELAILWVTEFPLLEYDKEEKRYVAKHHPFTSPMEEDLSLLENNPGKVRAKAYDLVINGMEAGGGSIRIHDSSVQENMFSSLGFSKEDAWERFGFLLEAFQYGVPPHGGIAFGFDRLCMILARKNSIRDVIAFPKLQTTTCPMTGAPDYVTDRQLEELAIRSTVE